MIKVMRTNGKDSEFMSKSEINPMHLFIVSGENCQEEHGYGDLLTNSDSDIKFAILGKEFVIHGTIQNPWFKAKDVAEWIEYDASSINKLISSVDEDEKVRKIVPTRGGNQKVWFLSENGVYEVFKN